MTAIQRPRQRRGLRAAGVVGLAFTAVISMGACAATENSIDDQFGAAAGQAHRIAECESGMNPRAVSRTNDHGLFQINQVHRNTFSQVTGQPWSAVYSPYFNAMFAKWLYDRQGWTPWTCRKVL